MQDVKTKTGWLDIETAPRDGTLVDLWVAWPDGDRRMADARWTDDHASAGKIGFDWVGRDRFPLGCFLAKPSATHWMPQPAPPSPDTHPKDGDVEQAPLVSGGK